MRYVCQGKSREKLCNGPCCTNVRVEEHPTECPEGYNFAKWVKVSPLHDEEWYPMGKIEALARKSNE